MTESSSATSPFPSSWWVVADPNDARVGFWQAALEANGLPAARVIDYRDLAVGRQAALAAVPPRAIVRIESPGRSPEIYRAFLRRGGVVVETRWAKGCVLFPSRWYRGFDSILASLRETLEPKKVRFTSHPEDVTCVFDKARCHAYLCALGVPVPPGLGPVRSFEELRERMAETRRPRVFVKLNHGSSASGVLAYETSPWGAQAWTTAELVTEPDGVALYNSRRIRRIRNEAEIASIVDELCTHGVHVEAWFPKASLDGHRFDLRVLTVAGEPAHIVARLGKSPMTNLHLLNRRVHGEAVRRLMPAKAWDALLETCRRVARAFPRTLQLGLDIAVSPGFRSHAVLEVNAFGDLLHGVEHNGLSTYAAQVRAIHGWGAA